MFVGLVAGLLAGNTLKDEGHGRLMDISMGICGAVLGGLLVKVRGL
jgi:uncharacterized membrane protein YeaQ/YmgE (transglycosylase-associated protein family)